MKSHSENYKWYILTLVILTDMFVVAIPTMGMAVLAKEISDDLKLTLVQVGIIWGIGALPGIVTSLLGGVVGDKFGPKRVLIASSLLGGLLGVTRGLANSFLSMAVIMFLLGAIIPVVIMSSIKALGQWFPPRQLGMANGFQAMSMALGFMLGSLLSATTLSPLLGGWRNVLITYGLIGALFSIPWFFTKIVTVEMHATSASLSIRNALQHVASLKNIWLLGLGFFGIGGAIQGALGYLPIYLRGEGWAPFQADGALSSFHTASMIFVLPIALWSDKLKSRKFLLLGAGFAISLGFGLLSFVSGDMVWAATLLSGCMRDAFMAIFLTMIIEQVESIYAGTATGFAMALGGLGNVLAPPVGNSLAEFGAGAPFAFWSALGFLGLTCLSVIKEFRHDKNDLTEKNTIEN